MKCLKDSDFDCPVEDNKQGQHCWSCHFDPQLEKAKLNKVKETPAFYVEFVGFSKVGNRTEAVLTLNPEWDLHHVMNTLHGPNTVRALNLVFIQKEKDFGRKFLSVKEEWKQKTVSGEKSNE